ncbi:MAG: hypothetical protein J6M08_03500 [Methanobrevibacter sp.]|nr:hypothetical protein [Methanobrevibacter sp.]
MHKHWREYAEMHSLEADIKYSDCSECKYVCDCQYYYGRCPKGLTPEEEDSL